MNGSQEEFNLTRTLSTQSGLSEGDAAALLSNLSSLSNPPPATSVDPTTPHDNLTRTLSSESGLSESDASDLCANLEELSAEGGTSEAEKKRQARRETRRLRCLDGLVTQTGMSLEGAEEVVAGWEEVFSI